jgi:host factor-I protein
MMTTVSQFQDTFLKALQKDAVGVALYLVNGIKLQGQIVGFDDDVVFLDNTMTQMVFKHAISTIVPNTNIALKDE